MLKGKIRSDLASALKIGNNLRLSVLRMLASAIHNKEIEKRTRLGQDKDVELDDEEVLQVVRSELKKRREAAEAYRAGGRAGAAEQEESEAGVLLEFLPAELSDAELEAIVAEGFATLDVSQARESGKVVGWVLARVKGRAGGERIAALIRKKLGDS